MLIGLLASATTYGALDTNSASRGTPCVDVIDDPVGGPCGWSYTSSTDEKLSSSPSAGVLSRL